MCIYAYIHTLVNIYYIYIYTYVHAGYIYSNYYQNPGTLGLVDKILLYGCSGVLNGFYCIALELLRCSEFSRRKKIQFYFAHYFTLFFFNLTVCVFSQAQIKGPHPKLN